MFVGCGGNFTAPTAHLTSPDYPDSYPHGAYCVWYLSVREHHSVKLHVNDIHLETSDDCTLDFIQVGPTTANLSQVILIIIMDFHACRSSTVPVLHLHCCRKSARNQVMTSYRHRVSWRSSFEPTVPSPIADSTQPIQRVRDVIVPSCDKFMLLTCI